MLTQVEKDLIRHRGKIASGNFHPNHADFYAARAARHDKGDPHTFSRVRSGLLRGVMTPQDIPPRRGDEPGLFDQ